MARRKKRSKSGRKGAGTTYKKLIKKLPRGYSLLFTGRLKKGESWEILDPYGGTITQGIGIKELKKKLTPEFIKKLERKLPEYEAYGKKRGLSIWWK